MKPELTRTRVSRGQRVHARIEVCSAAALHAWKDYGLALTVQSVQEYDIVFLTETKSKKNDIFNVPGYKSIIKNNYRDRLGGAGGVAIFYRNNMKIKRITDRKDRDEFDTIELKMELERKSSCRMLLVYRKLGKIKRAGTWKDLVKNMDKDGDRIVIGDFNAHNVIWNCEETDRNGNRLLEEFEDEDLFIINGDTKSRMGVMGQRDFNIDLVFASEGVLNYLEYYQEKDLWDSGFPNKIQIECRIWNL